MANSMVVPQRIKNRITTWPSNSTLGYISKKTKRLIWKDTLVPMFTVALFTTAKIWKQPKCPSINKWTKKMWYIYNEHYSAMLLLLLSRFSHVRLRATPQTAANQAPRPWDSPGKNTGVGCHFLLQCMKVKSECEVAQSCLTLSDPMDCSLPGSSVHGIF